MALLEGKTAEEMAREIVESATKDEMVTVSGTAFQKLETVVRYLNRDKIQARGEVWFEKNKESLTTDAVETLITAREKAIVDYLAKKEMSDKDEAFRLLVSKGVNVQEAYKKIYA